MKTRRDKRTTISLAQVIWEMAEKRMEAGGFNNNFSAYVADLIRRDRDSGAPAANPDYPYPPVRNHSPNESRK